MNTANHAHAPLPGSQAPGLLARVLAFFLSAAFLVLAFMFSLVALATVAIGVDVFAGWLRWKTRALRKAMRAACPTPSRPMPPRHGDIIEGEARRTDEALAPLPPRG